MLAYIQKFTFGIFDRLLLRYATFRSRLRECTSLVYYTISTILFYIGAQESNIHISARQ